MANNAKAIAAAGAGTLALIAAAAPFVAQWEGLRTDPYLDIASVATVCYGETHVEMRSYTKAECDAMLQRSLASHGGAILQSIPESAPTSVKLAFISLAYNMGPANIAASEAAKAARAGDYPKACANFAQWNLVKVKSEREWQQCPVSRRRVGVKTKQRYCVSPGLVNRRAAETKLCLSDQIRS